MNARSSACTFTWLKKKRSKLTKMRCMDEETEKIKNIQNYLTYVIDEMAQEKGITVVLDI